MSLSQKNLSAIQKAGQAVHGACEAISDTVQSQAASMVATIAGQPFDAASEQAISRFKMLSRLNQGLAEVESKMQALYTMANDLANPAADVIALPSAYKRKASNAAVVDVVAKPAKAAKATKKAKAGKGGRKPSALTGNDTKLLAFLQSALNTSEWTYLPGVAMAKGADLPLGSIGISLKKFIGNNLVKAGARGMYQLGAAAHATAPVEAPAAAKTEPAKAAKVVKAKPVKKAKVAPAAPAKKAKAPAPKKAKAAAKPSTTADTTAPAQTEAEAAPL